MENKAHIIANFETIFRENHKRPSLLYSKSKIPIKETNRPQDVLKIVSLQVKAIQMADRKDLNNQKKSNVLTQEKQAVYNKVLQKKTVNKFETQCVSDTQLVNIVNVAEAFEVDPGATQDMDVTFTASDLEKLSKEGRLNMDIEYTKNSGISNDKEIKGGGQAFISHDNSMTDIGIEKTLTGFTEDFTADNIICRDTTKEDGKEADINTENIPRIETTIVGFTEDFSEGDKDIFEDNDDACIDDDFNALERDRCLSLSPILAKINPIKAKGVGNALKGRDKERSLPERYNERSLSPVLGVKVMKESKSPSPLVFNLDSFEKFEQFALPLVEENHDLKTVKQLINSQILDKELFLPSKVLDDIALLDHPLDYVHNGQNVSANFGTVEDEKVYNSSSGDVKLKNDKEKNSSTLEDEILFSSDEEVYEHKEIQDLPFTCALETSFYEQSDILDKTMYVGFQTASNKSIQVFTESFTKAKSILNELDASEKKELTLTELVNICDSNPKTDQIKKQITYHENSNKTDTHMSTEMDDVAKLKKISGVVSNTCLGVKPVTITNLKECKTATIEETTQFPDINMYVPNEVMVHLSQDYKNAKNVQEASENDPESILKMELYNKNHGFKTANNKIIKLSDAALATCHKVFHNIIDEHFYENDSKDAPSKDVVTDTVSENNVKTNYRIRDNSEINDEIILQEFENVEMSVADNTSHEKQFEGFKTASHKYIRISDKATEKAKQMFEDIKTDLDDGDNWKPIQVKPNGNINNKIENSKQIDYGPTNTYKGSIGFKTASNKNIKISDLAIAKTKKIFHDIEFNNDDLVHKDDEAQGINIKKAGKSNMNDLLKPSTSKGFQTASNKNIVITSKALINSKNIFKGIDKPINQATDIEVEFQTFKEAIKNKKLSISQEPMLVDESICDKIPELNDLNMSANKQSDLTTNTIGFQTANNKPVHVSERALERTKKIFQEEISEHIYPHVIENMQLVCKSENVCNRKTLVSNGNFQTANNNTIHIPTRALERTKKIFHNLDNAELDREPDTILKNKPLVGFKTANNKEVPISEQALAKSKQIFNDLDVNDIADECIPPDFPNNSIKHTFKGFQTASNKNVKISKESLDKVKNIFQDIDFSSNYVHENNLTNDNATSLDISMKKSSWGFKTANNRTVCVSSDSLARSKRLFKDIDNIQLENNKINTKEIYPTEEIENNVYCKASGDFSGFKTASNKSVNISEEALLKSKQIFQDINASGSIEEFNTNLGNESAVASIYYQNFAKRFKPNDLHIDRNMSTVKDISNNINKENIADIIDTQVLNDFEDTLYTEDFREEVPSRNKRSGSPILSCPSAKRRRFKTPYKTNQIVTSIKTVSDAVTHDKRSIFTENYKKNRKYKLRDLMNIETDVRHVVDPFLMNFDFDTLLNFEFEGKRNDVTEHKIDFGSLKDIFLSSVNSKLVPNGWLENHIRLILWKLISYEVRFPKSLGTVCTAENVLNQLKFRYDKELYNAERSAFRKILEKDDVPSKTLVLFVVAILVDGVKVDSVTNTANNVELLLSDGWYYIMACIDKMLVRHLVDKKIVVGSKIATNGAELVNCDKGVAPWEDTSSVRLKIFGNSTRRARWDARLGYHGNGAMLSQLSHVKLDGGKVSKLRLFVARMYPPLYVEKFEDGSTVTRSERLEHLHQIKYETDRQNLLERLYEEVEKEFSDQDSQDSENTWDSNRIPSLQSGSQIFEAVKRCKDPCDIKNQLTASQAKLLEAHSGKRRERLLEKVHAKLMEKIDRSGLRQGRNVVAVLKIRVVGFDERNGGSTKGLLSVWKPNDALIDLIKEDSWIEVMNVVPTAIRYSEIQISAGRQSVFKQAKFKENDNMKTHIGTLKRRCYTIKELNKPPKTEFNEADTAGMVFLIEPSGQHFDSKSQFQNVYLSDKDFNMICVNFWGGMQKFGFQNVLDTGQIIACVNLQKRAGNTRNVPQFRATEFTYFTKTPKNQQAKEIIDELNKISVLDRKRICEECVKLKNNLSTRSNESITPYRINIDLGKEKAFLNSVEKMAHAELNLTGLDFESSFRQKDEELSPKTLKRKREVNNRINKLKMYGEPPPLTPIHIINKSKNALGSYKSPLINSEVSSGVANNKNCDISRNVEKITPVTRQDTTSVASCVNERNIENKDSPVTSLNKTYVKSSVNPVKLNFDNNTSDLVDQFAEEFDASPPLSLD